MFVTRYCDGLKPRRTSVLRFGTKSDPYSRGDEQWVIKNDSRSEYSENLNGEHLVAFVVVWWYGLVM